jgi:molybdate transport system ATP-binding protein
VSSNSTTQNSSGTIDACFKGRLGEFQLDMEFSIPAQGITALFGPSGCGKTSVLRCIAGLNHLPGGQLSIHGDVWQAQNAFLPTHKRPVGYVFQEANLFNHLSVRDNLLFGYKRSRNRNNAPKLDEIIKLLGLEKLLSRSPLNLSGGERQRVAIGRALMSSPEILLMDEPLAALDRFSKNEILPYLERLHDHLAIPVLYVSHDIAEVERLADQMILLDSGQIRAIGPLENLLSNPELPLARLPDAAMVMEARVIDFDEEYGLTTMAVLGGELITVGKVGPLHSRHRLRISASDVGLCRTRAPQGSSILNGPVARITGVLQNQPHQMTVFLNLGMDGQGAGLIARITRKSWDSLELQQGDTVHALIKGVALAK